MSHSTWAAGLSGGVCNGLLEPKMATCGTPNPAATCISPESLLTILFEALMTHRAWAKEVFPAKLMRRDRGAAATALAVPTGVAGNTSGPDVFAVVLITEGITPAGLEKVRHGDPGRHWADRGIWLKQTSRPKSAVTP